MAKIKISEDIEYDVISKEDFKEFVDVLEEKDSKEFEQEGADGFVDLYDYWNKVGNRRLQIKLSANKEAIEFEKAKKNE